MSVSVTSRAVRSTGPGGLSCPCCSDWSPRRDMRKVRRAIRRRDRAMLRLGLLDA